MIKSFSQIAIVCIVLTGFGHAQFETATVLGTVRDTTGAIIPGVSVTLENVHTGISSSTVTDEAGNYQFLNVKIGSYRVRAELAGFATTVAEDVIVTVNSRQRVDLVLQVGEISMAITVAGAAKLLETDSSDRGQLIDNEQIVDLPLNGRNYADLALLTTGVRKGLRGDREASFNVHGQRFQMNNFQLDGVDNNAYQTSNEGYSNQVVQVSPDALEEFKVQTSNYSAEYGRAAGAVVNASIRSGTNKVNLTLWEFGRNTALNAVGFFKPVGGQKPTLVQNQFGFALGGPMVRDRTFFFIAYEGLRRIDRKVRFVSIPTLDLRNGKMGVPIRNPYTGQLYADGIIPRDHITAFAKKVMGQLVEPNLPGLASNYVSLPRNTDFTDKFDIKIDHHFNSKMNGFLRFSQRKSNVDVPYPIPAPIRGAPPPGGQAIGLVNALNQAGVASFTYFFSPKTAFDVRMGYSRTLSGKRAPDQGGPNMRELYGITGLPEGYPSGGLNTQSIGGFDSFGRAASQVQSQNPRVYNPRVNFSKIMGRQTLKLGFEFLAVNTSVMDNNPPYGSDSYSGQFSRPAGGRAASAIYNTADFLFGARNRYQLANVWIPEIRQRMYFAFVQDDFKFSPKLTINMGMRYEFATPQHERDNKLSNYDPATNSIIFPKAGSLYDRSLVRPDRNNFAPRLGVAYSLTPKWVVRSGFGVSYAHFNRAGAENLLMLNGPSGVRRSVSQLPSQGLCTPMQDPTTCFRPTEMGYPPDFVAPDKFVAAAGRFVYLPADTRAGYVMSWHLTLQRELARKLMLDVAYVGNRSVKLMVLADYNQARPNAPGENRPVDQRRPHKGFGFIEIAYPGGVGTYNGLEAKLERRFAEGLALLNSFTWSKAIDLAPGHLEEVGVGIFGSRQSSRINYYHWDWDKGLSTVDQPFLNVTSMMWELPVGRGRRFGSNFSGLLEAFLGGWKTTLINWMGSGNTITLTYEGGSAFDIGTVSTRPNVIGDPYGDRTVDNYFNKNTVIIPTDRSKPFGNVGRNTVRSHAVYTTDFGLQKDFRFSENTRLQFRGEFFNLFNKTNFHSASASRSSINFGQIRSAYPPREVQLALKLYFGRQ